MCNLAIYMVPINSAEFLSRIWPERLLNNELLELRLIDRKTGAIRREFCSSIKDILTAVEKCEAKYDIYFGVSTRFGRGGKKRDCYRTRVVWTDLDRKGGWNWEKARSYSFNPKPDLLVDSGTGVHAYWILRTPVLLQIEERRVEVEAINRGLAEKFGGDEQCADASRILRVPGTYNLKYQPKRLVKAYDILHQ